MLRVTVLALVAASQLSLAGTAQAANYGNLTRREIRSMPILERPSRPGHFYGNTVRRNYYRNLAQQSQFGYPGTMWQGYAAPSRMNGWVEQEQTSEYIISE
jgi:hypothetical protein